VNDWQLTTITGCQRLHLSNVQPAGTGQGQVTTVHLEQPTTPPTRLWTYHLRDSPVLEDVPVLRGWQRLMPAASSLSTKLQGTSLNTSRQHLQSARCHQLSVPRVRRSTVGTRAFFVTGPTV